MNATLFVLAFVLTGAEPVRSADTAQTLLYVRTTPAGAEIRLDGKPLGKADGLFPVKAGVYKITLDLTGYQPEEQQITVRDGRITRIELTLRPGSQAREPDKLAPGTPAATTGARVVEGVGWGAFRVGATRDELIMAYGPPEPSLPGSQWVRWISKHHVDCLIDPNRGAFEIRFNEGFTSPLSSGIRIGSSESEVLSAYGKPNRTVDNGAAKMFEWEDRGVLLWVINGKVYDFTVFSPHPPTPTPDSGQGASGAATGERVVEGVGWRDFRVGATREELVKAFGPPEPSLPGSQWVRWVSKHHVDCLIDPNRGASEIRFSQGFASSLTSGIRIGSSESDVLSAYGEPNRTVNRAQAKMLEWDDRGVLLWIINGKVFDFTVFKPLVSDAAKPSQPASNARTASDAQNILKNPSIEDGDRTPDAWQKGAAVPSVKYSWDRTVAFEGKSSLCIEKTVQRYFPIAQWSQTVERDGSRPALTVSAQVKAESMTKAILDVIFLDDQGKWISHQWAAYIGSKAPGDPPANHDWKPYSGRVDIPPQTKKVTIALQVYGPGKVWFDNVRAGYSE